MQSKVFDSRFVRGEVVGESPDRDAQMRSLVVVLHGRGDSVQGFEWLPEAMRLPGVDFLLLNAPDDYFGGFSWYGLPPDQLPGIKRSSALLDQLLEETAAAGYPVSKTFLFGFSQGALMGWEWGGRIAVPLAGIVGISGYVFDADRLVETFSEAGRATPRLVTHGTLDDVLPFEASREQAEQIRAAGIPFEWREYAKHHSIDPQELAEIRAWMSALIRAWE